MKEIRENKPFCKTNWFIAIAIIFLLSIIIPALMEKSNIQNIPSKNENIKPEKTIWTCKNFVFKGATGWKILEETLPEAIKPIEEGRIVYKMKKEEKNILGVDEAIFSLMH